MSGRVDPPFWPVDVAADCYTAAEIAAALDRRRSMAVASSGPPVLAVQGHAGPVHSVALSRDGRVLASGGEDGTIQLWDAVTGQPLATLRGHASALRSVALSADGRLLASGGLDGRVRLWEPGSGACLRILRSDRCYERMDIGGLTGVNAAQHAALLALGVVERTRKF